MSFGDFNFPVSSMTKLESAGVIYRPAASDCPHFLNVPNQTALDAYCTEVMSLTDAPTIVMAGFSPPPSVSAVARTYDPRVIQEVLCMLTTYANLETLTDELRRHPPVPWYVVSTPYHQFIPFQSAIASTEVLKAIQNPGPQCPAIDALSDGAYITTVQHFHQCPTRRSWIGVNIQIPLYRQRDL